MSGRPALSPEALRAAVPPLGGTLRLAGLEAPVEVFRDRHGVPQVRARSAHDAFFGQGFVHAQDRMFQLDVDRRRACGRWAEWAGPAGVAADAFARRLDIAGASRRDLAGLAGETCAMLEAYAQGVNAFIALGHLSAEHLALGAEPERWEAWQCLAVARQKHLLMGSFPMKLWRALALRALGPDLLAHLRHDDGGRDLLVFPQGEEARRLVDALESLAPAIAAVAELAPADASGGGSNNWALSGARTASGRPLLGGDPHRVFEFPTMYAQGHVACDAFDAVGFSTPGYPGFPHFGHNGRVAWCVTHAFADIHDLYVERFDRADPARVLHRGTWRTTERRTERIAVKDAAAVEIEAVRTPHGPVIAGDPRGGTALSLRSMQITEPDRSFDCVLPMLRAGSVAALFDAVRGWRQSDHHLVAADVAGRIGHTVRAHVPRRPRLAGWLPVPGWDGRHEWDGTIPADELPRTIDPPDGRLVTANNRVAADDFPHYFQVDCHPSHRARRVAARLAALGRATTADMAAIPMDALTLPGLAFRDRLRGVAPADDGARAVLERIAAWDGVMGVGSAGAACYAALRWALTDIVFERSGLARIVDDPVRSVPAGVGPTNQLWWAIPGFLRRGDARPLGGWTWDRALGEAASRAASALAAKLGPDPADWRWGGLHRTAAAHPLAPLDPAWAAAFTPPPLAVAGDCDTALATGHVHGPAGFSAVYGALARYVFAVGDWDASLWTVAYGASGHPGSPHWADRHAGWARGEMAPMRYSWDLIAREAEAVQTLEPAG